MRLRRTSWPHDLELAVRAAAADAGAGWDQILAAVQVDDSTWAAGTRQALHLPHEGGLRRIGWEEIERAEWRADESLLRVWETAAFGTPMRSTDLRMVDPGRFGQLVRERISASMLIQRHVPLAGPKGVRIVGRRNPADPSADVIWNFVLDEGLDPAQPGLLNRAESALAAIRTELGI